MGCNRLPQQLQAPPRPVPPSLPSYPQPPSRGVELAWLVLPSLTLTVSATVVHLIHLYFFVVVHLMYNPGCLPDAPPLTRALRFFNHATMYTPLPMPNCALGCTTTVTTTEATAEPYASFTPVSGFFSELIDAPIVVVADFLAFDKVRRTCTRRHLTHYAHDAVCGFA